MAAKIKKGDSVIVLTGKDKGRQGTVLKVVPDENRALVSGINMVSRHVKPSQTNPQGGIKRQEALIHISNLANADPKTGEATRVGFKMDGDKKVRYAKKSGEVISG
jgi:large subunit ribosomal protein L24